MNGTAVPVQDFETAAWSWVAHLRQAGTMPWRDWASSGSIVEACHGPWLPGAAELEFVRRLASRTATKGPAFTAVADLAMNRTGPGRGLAQLPLLRPGGQNAPRIGPRPVDPASIPQQELIRIGIGVLADLLIREDADVPVDVPAEPPRRRRFWSRSFRLSGAPLTTATIRAELALGGHVEGGRHPVVLILATSLDELLAQVWSRRVQTGAHVRWSTFVNTWAHRNALPPSADLVAITRHWAGRTGGRRVHVVIANDDPTVRRTAGNVLRFRLTDTAAVPEFAMLSPAGTELLRKMNVLLDGKVGPDRRRDAIRRLVSNLGGSQRRGPVVPERHRDWLQARATTMVEQLRHAHCTVHGDLGVIGSTSTGTAGTAGSANHLSRRETLDLVLDACLRTARIETRGAPTR